MAQATISVTIKGTIYPATYELERGIVTVRTDIGTRSAPMGNSPPDAVARMLLRELIQVETLRRERIIRASNHAGE
jgi:hypothetical protein